MWSTSDADITLKKTTSNAGSRRDFFGNVVLCTNVFTEVMTFDRDDSRGIFVFDSEGSVDETAAHHLHIGSDGDASVRESEHLDDQLVVGDPWGDLDSVVHHEGVVIVGGDVVEGDGVWLLSASSHAEELVALWVVEEVLVPSGVGHQEGEGRRLPHAGREWVVAPVVNAVVAVSLGELDPALGLVVGLKAAPPCKRGSAGLGVLITVRVLFRGYSCRVVCHADLLETRLNRERSLVWVVCFVSGTLCNPN